MIINSKWILTSKAFAISHTASKTFTSVSWDTLPSTFLLFISNKCKLNSLFKTNWCTDYIRDDKCRLHLWQWFQNVEYCSFDTDSTLAKRKYYPIICGYNRLTLRLYIYLCMILKYSKVYQKYEHLSVKKCLKYGSTYHHMWFQSPPKIRDNLHKENLFKKYIWMPLNIDMKQGKIPYTFMYIIFLNYSTYSFYIW